MITYEEQLNGNLHWALQQGSLHFEDESAVHKTFTKIARNLEEIGVSYATMHSTEIAGFRVLSLPKLIELKIAAGISHRRRLKHLGDVEELIAALRLPETLAEQLDPSVRSTFLELWKVVDDNPVQPE